MTRDIADNSVRAALAAVPDAALVVNAQGEIVLATDRAEAIFGHAAGSLSGRPAESLVPPRFRRGYQGNRRAYFSAPRRRPTDPDHQLFGLHQDGHEFPIALSLTPVEGADDGLVVCAVRDASERRRLEDSLRRALSTLSERTAALEFARNDALRANQLKTRFLTAVSHDLRQPLQSIAALVGVLRRKTAEPQSRAIAEKMEDSIGHMVDMIDSLLDIGQIESGEIKPDIVEFPVSAILERKAREFAVLAETKGIELRFVKSSALVRSDPHLLERIIGNLLSNAIKYTDRGRVLLGCRLRGAALRIEIWDTGIGIAREHFQDIFREFYRVDPADSAEVGLGLGLYFVRRVSSLLDHAVDLDSRSGKGTMFSLTVPMVGRGDRTGAAVPAGARRPTVLLVEDDPRQLRDLGALLESEGYQVVAATRGEDALSAVKEGKRIRPDVIICDYNLGAGMKGPEIIQSVRAAHHAHIPALVLTADKTASSRWDIESNNIGYLGKPVKASSFIGAVDSLVEKEFPGWTRSERPPAPGLPTPADAASPEIGLVDDEPDVREALRLMLEAEGYRVAAYPSGEALLADPARKKLRCLIVDILLPQMQGVELQEQLKGESSQVPIVFMSGKGEVPLAVQAMRAGAADFLQKPVRSSEVLESVSRAISGHQTAERADTSVRLASLSRREREVLRGMIDGKMNKVIATELGISIRTTEHHRESVMRKMGVRSLAMLVRKVAEGGLGENYP